jgi:FkbH-like protein
MFQLDWYDERLYKDDKIKKTNSPINILNKDDVEAIGLTFWAEHCLECAPPECYKNCKYYIRRPDGRCRRTAYGLKQIKCDNSILGYGVRYKYLPWAKLETKIFSRSMTMEDYINAAQKYKNKIHVINNKLSLLNAKGILNSAEYFWINKVLAKFPSKEFLPNCFILQLYSFHAESYNMLIEAVAEDGRVISRASMIISSGFNEFRLSYKELWPQSENPIVLRMYPENNIEAELDLYTAEFVRLKQSLTKKAVPAQKVKCVAWDLDNTVWNGILVEADQNALTLRDGVFEMMEELDKRGILQTVVSKNDYEFAWPQLEKLGVSKYFLYPAINWGQKSRNLEQIAKELNINTDTFALIDDSSFERAEVQNSLSQVRVYPENNLRKLLELNEFDVPITVDTSKRREMYQIEEKRKQILSYYDGNYLDFIKSCKIKIDICPVDTEERKKRCYELIQRTNQLNLTGQKYSEIEFQNILNDSNRINLSIDCSDKFGDYGTVGFFSIYYNSERITVLEMAISCRVAQKHIEYAMMSWIARKIVSNKKIDILNINYKDTGKNKPVLKALTDIGFEFNVNEERLLQIDVRKIIKDDEVIAITESNIAP